jgi:tripartite-type tricarboxylate transporter receptor subunit TctC
MKNLRCLAGALALVLAPVPGLHAQEWPTRPVRLVVPFPPGAIDVLGRVVAQRLAESLGQPFVIENRPGAGGNLGTDLAAKSAPDGYTVVLSTSGPLTNNRFLYKSLPYDPARDLTPIILVGETPLLIVASPKLGVRDLRGFVEAARAKPGAINVGSPGRGTNSHLTIELLKSMTRTDMVHVAYQGSLPALTALLGGHIQAEVALITDLVQSVRAGSVTGIAITAKTRFEGLPDLPTAKEQGYDIDSSGWAALMGPAGMPRPIVDRINRALDPYLRSAAGRAKLVELGVQAAGGPPENVTAMMATDSAKWRPIIESVGITLD